MIFLPKIQTKTTWIILFWTVGVVAFLSITWGVTLTRIKKDRQESEQAVYQLASAYSKAYAEQLARTISQIEQLTLSLQYQWVENKAKISLEKQLMYGLFPSSGGINVTIVDLFGKSVTSTLPGPPLDAVNTEYFKFHRMFADSRLRVDDQVIYGQRIGKPIIRFTRRLDAEDGSFNGVIVVGMEPAYLASFNDGNSLAEGDFISIRHKNGALIVSETGKANRGLGQVHIEPPLFNSVAGVKKVEGNNFKDGHPRILAWQENDAYPLISYAGLSEAARLAMHFKTAREYKKIALTASAISLLFSILGLLFSVRYQKRKQHAEEVKAIFRLATDAANEGFYMVCPVYGEGKKIIDFIFEDCNEHGAKLVSMNKDALIGGRLTAIFDEAHNEETMSIYRQAMHSGFYEDEVRTSVKSPWKATWIYRRLARSGDGLAVTIRDISEKKAHESTLLDMANTDSLTGLPNRYWLVYFLPEAIEKAKKHNSIVAVLFVDLDGFKDVNDSLGHSTGDQLLKAVSARLSSLLRPHDYVVRLGGDEFTVVLTDVFNVDEVAQIASRVSESFSKPFQIATHNGVVRASIGISMFPQDGDTKEVLLQKADIAMYAAKAEGKGEFRFCDDRLYSQLKHRLEIESELSTAIAEDQFLIYYQPRVETRTGKVIGLEALVRWFHPKRGMVPPLEFIPLAESTGAIIPLGILILRKVCEQLTKWDTQGAPVVPVSVNISPRQFNEGGIDQLISSLLREYHISPGLIEVEVTESAMMNNSEEMRRQVAAIKAMGISMHLDDFGTGYSSLSRLQELNLDVLKIDQAFISRIGQDSAGATLISSIISMVKAFNMRVVAEGVETSEQFNLLIQYECDEMQGYFISKPLPANEIIAFVRKESFLEKYECEISAI